MQTLSRATPPSLRLAMGRRQAVNKRSEVAAGRGLESLKLPEAEGQRTPGSTSSLPNNILHPLHIARCPPRRNVLFYCIAAQQLSKIGYRGTECCLAVCHKQRLLNNLRWRLVYQSVVWHAVCINQNRASIVRHIQAANNYALPPHDGSSPPRP